MNRRSALLKSAGLSLAAGVSAVMPSTVSAQRILSPGKNFRLLNPPRRTHAHVGKIEVIEFFWIGCPHCRAIEPAMISWEKRLPADVLFRKVHVNFRVPTHQRLYYTLETLKQADKLLPDVFAEIHDRRNRLQTERSVFDYAERQGIDRSRFKATYQSFGVQTRMRRASQQVADYGVDSVPLLAINGKFLTSPSMAGSNGAAITVVDALISQERGKA